MSGGRYHSVTTSLEYVLVGIDLARARPGRGGKKEAAVGKPWSRVQLGLIKVWRGWRRMRLVGHKEVELLRE